MTVRRCPICRCYFIAPAPSEEALAEFYGQYAETHRLLGLGTSSMAKAFLAADPFADLRVREICSMMDLAGKRVLDVGCSYGHHMVSFRKLGADVFGIDLDESAITFASQQLGLSVCKQWLTELSPEHGKFDLIWMGDFIEHPLEPYGLLQHAATLLNPEGLLMLWTPSASLCEREEYPVLFRVDLEHMQYMSVQTCSYVARTLGLDLVHLETIGYPSESNWKERGTSRQGAAGGLRRLARRLPGYRVLAGLRHGLRRTDPRMGAYHLACLLQKPARAQAF